MDNKRNTRGAQPRDERDIKRNDRQEAVNELPAPETPNDVFEILDIILLDESRQVPMARHLRMVEVDKVRYYLEMLAKMLPRTIPESRRIMEDKANIIAGAQREARSICADAENHARVIMDDADSSANAIIAEARAEADRILDEARKEARLLVDKSEVRRIAEDEAGKLMASVRKNASDTVANATNYVNTMLSNLEDLLKTELSDVQKSRADLAKGRD